MGFEEFRDTYNKKSVELLGVAANPATVADSYENYLGIVRLTGTHGDVVFSRLDNCLDFEFIWNE